MANLYPVPPTTNNLDPVQRKQLLKSTQKLGTLLGTTPRVLESGAILPPPLTPGTKAFRREGKVFYAQSASSSRTSLDSCEAESYIWIPSPTEVLTKHWKSASSPISIEFPHVKLEDPVALKTMQKKAKPAHQRNKTVPQQLSQPLLYRLRSRPTPPRNVSPALPSSPLSPVTRLPSTSTAGSTGSKQLSDSDRRRKMAKLMRTLGETIPPELVFGNPPPRTASLAPKPAGTSASSSTVAQATSASRAPSRRRRSATGAGRPNEPSSRSSPSRSPPAPALPAKDTIPDSVTNEASLGANDNLSSAAASSKFPPQTPVVTVTTTFNTTNVDTTTTAKRKERPRSLSLVHTPVGLRQGIVVEQDRGDQPLAQPIVTSGRQPSRSLDEHDWNAVGRSREASVSTSTINNVEFGYRKERDWSGEWNVKDMDEVMGALRGLRIR